MPRSLLHRIALFAEARHRWILAAAAVLAALSLAVAVHLRFDPDVLALLPRDDPAVRTFRATLEEFGGLDLLPVVVRLPEGATVDPYLELGDALERELVRLPEIRYVDARIGAPEELLRAFFPRAPLFLDAAGRAQLELRLSDAEIRARLRELRRQLTTPQGLLRKRLMLLDPLGLSELFVPRVARGRGALGIDWTSGHYLSRDHRLLLLLAKPAAAAQDVRFDRRLVRAVRGAADRALERWTEIAGPGAPPPPEVALGGGYVTALEDAALIRRDLIVNAVGSMGVVLALFLFAFRRLGLLLYAFIPLSLALLVTFAVAGVTVGSLSSATSGCAALLIGLGIDFVIVSYGRYVEERHAGAGTGEALGKMTGSCGRAVVVGGVTSAATFYAFAVTRFVGLRQMGLLTGTGILLSMGSVLLLLPALLAWSEARHARRETEPTLFLHGFGGAWLVRRCLARPRPVLAAGVALTLGAAFLVPRVRFEDSIQKLRSEGNRGIAVQQEIAAHFGSSFEYMMLVLSAPSQPQALALAERAAGEARRLVEAGVLVRVESIADFLPSPGRQREVLGWLARRRAGPLDPERIRRTVGASLAAQGLRAEPFREGLDLLERALSLTAPIGGDEVTANDAAGRLLERYLRRGAGGWKTLVYLYLPPQVWKRQPPPQVEALTARLGPSAVLTGVNVVSRQLRRQVWKDAWAAAVLGTLAVALLLWLDYRSWRATLLSLVPLAIGILWMLGAMVVLGIAMNFMNVFVTTMILGIGVDYGVHMLHRHRELAAAPWPELVAGLAETGRAIAMAAATTVVGFGSLVLSHYPGLRSIGYLATLGAVSTALVAITLLPAYLALRRLPLR